MKIHIRGFVVRADDSEAADTPLTVVATTEGRKGDGIDLKMDNADLARFRANPVIMYGHEYWGREALPIGRADKVEIDGPRLLEQLAFDEDDEFAVKVERKMRNRYLNAVSIGFDAHDISDDGVPARWELFETSVVPLPMDADALVDSGRDARMLARFLDHARAGKVLSAKNTGLVEDAIAALTALLEAAKTAEDDSGDDDEGRGRRSKPRMAAARAKLLSRI